MIWDPYQAAAEQQLKARTLRDGKGLVDTAPTPKNTLR